MTGPKKPGWQISLEKNCPELWKSIHDVEGKVMVDGALPLKTKVLMMMLCDCLLAHPEGVAGIAGRARSMGASEAEIAETLEVAFLSGGLPAVVTGASAFRDEA